MIQCTVDHFESKSCKRNGNLRFYLNKKSVILMIFQTTTFLEDSNLCVHIPFFSSNCPLCNVQCWQRPTFSLSVLVAKPRHVNIFLLSVCSLSVQKMSEGFIGLENSPLCVLMLRIKSMLAKSHIEIAAVLHSSVYRRIDQNIFLQKFRESLCGCQRARLGFS